MDPLSDNSIGSAKLTTMAMIFLAAFALYGLYCLGTVNQVKVNGPFYTRIVQGKDVIADILPPPAYLIEAYLLAFQMYDDKDGAELPRLMVAFGKAKDDYLARHAYWQANLPESDLKSSLVEASFLPGMRMLEAVEQKFVPALQAGQRSLADSLLHGPIREEYTRHRAAIEQVVALAIKRNRQDETGAEIAVRSRAFGQVGLGIFLITLLTFLSWRWGRGNESQADIRGGAPSATRA